MKFGKNLLRVVELSDPEWGPFWMNYKWLKKKINDIVLEQGGKRAESSDCNPQMLSKSVSEVEFFRVLKSELQKTSDFFRASEQLYRVRQSRVNEAYAMLRESGEAQGRLDRNSITRLLQACVKFYKDVLLLENFAIMNYCGFSKILKKHDKLTGYSTREAYMRNVMSKQNFTHYPYVLELLRESEKLFGDIQCMQNAIPIHAEERLFIEAIRDLNYQASRLQAEENADCGEIGSGASGPNDSKGLSNPNSQGTDEYLNVTSALFPHVMQQTKSSSSVQNGNHDYNNQHQGVESLSAKNGLKSAAGYGDSSDEGAGRFSQYIVDLKNVVDVDGSHGLDRAATAVTEAAIKVKC